MRERKHDDAGLTPKERFQEPAKFGNEGTSNRAAQFVR